MVVTNSMPKNFMRMNIHVHEYLLSSKYLCSFSFLLIQINWINNFISEIYSKIYWTILYYIIYFFLKKKN